MLHFTVKGNFNNTENFFRKSKKLTNKLLLIFDKYGREGVEALQRFTPKDTGQTANSWNYEVTTHGIYWTNSRTISGITPLAILIQYGHGTRGGTYIEGIDYINPALKPIFNRIGDDIWKEVEAL